MKNISKLIRTISLLIYLGAALTTYGQNNIRVGITGGPNVSQIKTSTNLLDPLWKYNAGFAFAKPLPGNFSLASELVYSRQGGSLDVSRPTRPAKYITHFDYISLPALVRLSLGGKDVFVQGGGKFSYLINSERIYTGDYNTSTPNDLNHLRQWDAGAIGGVGYWLGNHIVVDARYYYGMTPLIKKHTVLDPVTLEPIFYGADKLYNRVWSLNLTFYL